MFLITVDYIGCFSFLFKKRYLEDRFTKSVLPYLNWRTTKIYASGGKTNEKTPKKGDAQHRVRRGYTDIPIKDVSTP